MNSSVVPVLQISLEGVRHNVNAMLTARNDEINRMVQESLDKQLNEEWILFEIDKQVKECLSKAIGALSVNYKLQNTITELLVDTLTKKLEGE